MIIGVRFLYGLRLAGPIIIGSGGVSPWRFAAFNMIGAALWAVLVAGAGYYFGVALQALFTDIKRIEEIILIAILAVGFFVWLWRRKRQARTRITAPK